MLLSVTKYFISSKGYVEISLTDKQCQRSWAVLSEHHEMLAEAELQEASTIGLN